MKSILKHKAYLPTAAIQDKFGRVFVKQRASPEIPSFISKQDYKVVDSVYFSNLKYRLYDGNNRFDCSKYTGRPFSLGYQGHLLKMPIPFGKNIVPNLDNLELAFEKEICVAKDLHLIDSQAEETELQKKLDLMRKSGLFLLWALVNPGIEIVKQDFLLKLGPFLYIDDMNESLGRIDKFEKTKPSKQLPYSQSSRLALILAATLESNHSDENSDPFQPFKNDTSSLITAILEGETEGDTRGLSSLAHIFPGLLSLVRRESIKTGKMNGCSPKPFLGHVAGMIDAFLFETSREWHEDIMRDLCAQETLLPTLSVLRHTTVGGVFFLESILLQRGIQLGEHVRASTLFKLILVQLTTHLRKVNDLVSFDKEMNEGPNEWKNNEASVLYKSGREMSVFEVKQKMAVDANSALEQIQVLCGTLKNLWVGKEEEVEIGRFVRALEELITGHLQWTAVNDYRYEVDVKLDCYIH